MSNIKDTDRGMSGFLKAVSELKKSSLKVGVFSDAVNNEQKGAAYVADYAIANEYGTERIPERSFLRSTIDEKHDEWSKGLSDVLMNAAKNKTSIDNELYKIGAIARSDIIDKIDSDISPKNAPATIKKKGAGKNKTLVDTGVLRSSIEARIGRN
jgi:predicted molibdopterin-dependent oxidoreductase YjgC